MTATQGRKKAKPTRSRSIVIAVLAIVVIVAGIWAVRSIGTAQTDPSGLGGADALWSLEPESVDMQSLKLSPVFALGTALAFMALGLVAAALGTLLGSGAGWFCVVFGAVMLLAYSVGHSILAVIAGTSTGYVKALSQSNRYGKVATALKHILGAYSDRRNLSDLHGALRGSCAYEKACCL